MEQTANSRLKMMQPRTTGPFQTFLLFFLSFFIQRCLLEVSDSLAFHSLLVRTEAVSFSSPARGAADCSKDASDEDGHEGHDGGANQTGDGHRHEPRHEDVSEETPVYRFL